MSQWKVPRVYVSVDWPPVLTVGLNPNSVAYPGTGCEVMEVASHDLPFVFVPDAGKVAGCAAEHTELWVSNQPWQPEVTCKLQFASGVVTLVQGTQTLCDLSYDAADNTVHLTYRLVKT